MWAGEDEAFGTLTYISALCEQQSGSLHFKKAQISDVNAVLHITLPCKYSLQLQPAMESNFPLYINQCIERKRGWNVRITGNDNCFSRIWIIKVTNLLFMVGTPGKKKNRKTGKFPAGCNYCLNPVKLCSGLGFGANAALFYFRCNSLAKSPSFY